MDKSNLPIMTSEEHEEFMGYLDEWLSIAKGKMVSYGRFMNYPPAVEYNNVFNELTYMDFEEYWGSNNEKI